MPDRGERVRVRVEVPRGSRIKRGPRGEVEFVSPFRCPFNYGSIVGSAGPDGDPIDGVVLGPRLARGAEVDVAILGVVRFTDGGCDDDKWICGAAETSVDRAAVAGFFRRYAVLKRLLGRGSRVRSIEWFSERPTTAG